MVHGREKEFDDYQALKKMGKMVDSKLLKRELPIFYMWRHNCSTKKIAEALSISRPRVGALISRIRNLIREELEFSHRGYSDGVEFPPSITLRYYSYDSVDHLEYCEREWRGDQLDMVCELLNDVLDVNLASILDAVSKPLERSE